MSKNIVITPGDGIGKEVTVQARKVMEYMAKRFQIVLEFTEVPIGGTAYDLTEHPYLTKPSRLVKLQMPFF